MTNSGKNLRTHTRDPQWTMIQSPTSHRCAPSATGKNFRGSVSETAVTSEVQAGDTYHVLHFVTGVETPIIAKKDCAFSLAAATKLSTSIYV